MEIHGSHGSHDDPYTTARKPDIIITSLNAAKRAADRETDAETWSSVVNTYAPNKPRRPFIWPDVLSSDENRLWGHIKMPSDYSPAQMPQTIPAQLNIYETFDSMTPNTPSEPQPTVVEPRAKRQKKQCA